MAKMQKAKLEDVGEEGKDLTAREDEAVEERISLRPLAVYEVIRREGVEELKRPLASLWWSGLAAGLSIGFSVVAEGALHAHLPDVAWRGLVESLGYSVGFLIVILGRYQLFTEITLTAVLPVLAEPSRASLFSLLRIWGVVLAANLVGTALFGAMLASGLFLPNDHQEGILAIARDLGHLSPSDALWRGVLGGWLVATVVWLMPSAESSRFAVILILTSLISALELSHVISGSVEIFLLLMIGEIGFGAALGGLLLPLLVGNVIGGSALFALLAYGQVKEELKAPEDPERKAAQSKPRPKGEEQAARA